MELRNRAGGKKRGSAPNPPSINTFLVKKEFKEFSKLKVLGENVSEGCRMASSYWPTVAAVT